MSVDNYIQNACIRVPAPNFHGKRLVDIYNHHLSLRDLHKEIHPLYFIVADNADFKNKGLLGVHLDCGLGLDMDMPGATGSQVDIFRCGTDTAATIGMNLDVGDVARYDYKEEEEEAFGGFVGKDINVMLELRQQSQ
ncbi:uncharacterized protein TRUGW13939_09983 [Talaromyces rugulosus]|uniref:Uncharacterized protein n=1 Tax=Talaromyces rugulosus TaxID=121627 RepID=A0A7H8RA33_TALRU|nr:uncharacterized protein TRUGW13939_09983 [Talaromyces rugulosus]QKX62818.1 hypothetical protein TRUGW13939_09983 [Talaromyces rugulosus]